MAMHARWLNQNLIYWDTHQARWLDAWGPGVRKIRLVGPDWPITAADTLLGWTTTLVEAGAGESTVTAGTDTLGGTLVITTDAAENDGVSLQKKGEAFQLTTGKPCYFGVRLKCDEATQDDFIVGLCITNTALLGGMTDGIYFRKVDASATVSALLEKNSTETSTTALTLVADTYTVLEIFFDGTTAHFYVDGTQLTDPVQTNLPDDELLTPSIEFLTGEAVAHTLTIDWMVAIQLNN